LNGELNQIELDDEPLEGGRRGWPMILSNLKTLLETGRPQPEFDLMEDAKTALEESKQAAKDASGKGVGRGDLELLVGEVLFAGSESV